VFARAFKYNYISYNFIVSEFIFFTSLCGFIVKDLKSFFKKKFYVIVNLYSKNIHDIVSDSFIYTVLSRMAHHVRIFFKIPVKKVERNADNYKYSNLKWKFPK